MSNQDAILGQLEENKNLTESGKKKKNDNVIPGFGLTAKNFETNLGLKKEDKKNNTIGGGDPSMRSQQTILDRKDNSISLRLHNDSKVNWNMGLDDTQYEVKVNQELFVRDDLLQFLHVQASLLEENEEL